MKKNNRQPQQPTTTTTKTAPNKFKTMASAISKLLRNDSLPDNLYEAIFGVLRESEASKAAIDSPEYIENFLKLFGGNGKAEPADEIKRLAMTISNLLKNETLGSRIKLGIIYAFGNEDDESFSCDAALGTPEYNEKWLRHFAGRYYSGEQQLAFQILNILGNEFLPFPVRNGIINGLADVGADFDSETEKIESFQYIADYLTYYNADDGDILADTIEGCKGEKLASVLESLLENENLPHQVHNAITQTLIAMQSRDDDRLLDAETIADILNRAQNAKGKNKQSLDLSQMSAKDLQADDCHADTASTEEIAVILSGLLKNPLFPTKLYNVLTDELCEVPPDTDAPENILRTLKVFAENDKTQS